MDALVFRQLEIIAPHFEQDIRHLDVHLNLVFGDVELRTPGKAMADLFKVFHSEVGSIRLDSAKSHCFYDSSIINQRGTHTQLHTIYCLGRAYRRSAL